MVAVALVAPAEARAESIVFVRAGDIWLTTPDGSREHRVTRSGGFATVTQADDGTIVGIKGGALHRMNRSGEPLNPPFKIKARGPGGSEVDATPIEPDLSPDGTKVAFWVMSLCEPFDPTDPIYDPCERTQVTDADKATHFERYGTDAGWKVTWMTNSRMIYSNRGAYIHTLGFGLGNWDEWFPYDDGFDPVYLTADSRITRAQDKVAVVGSPEYTGPWGIRFFSTNGAPPAEPTARCTRNLGMNEPSRLTWSPDSTGFAWQDGGGVRVIKPFDIARCDASPTLTIAGARSPDWGPAGVPTSSGPGPDPDPDPGAAPVTTITKAPPKKMRTARRKVRTKFKFRADKPATFKCKLDRKPWKRCASPHKARVKRGKHVFRVRATDRAGNTGRPAVHKWKVVRRRR